MGFLLFSMLLKRFNLTQAAIAPSCMSAIAALWIVDRG